MKNITKKLLIVLATITLTLFSSNANAQVTPEEGMNNAGQTFFRLHNNTPVWLNCYYRDQYNYFTFVVQPWSTSQWYRTFGVFIWECKY
jgi:hypothetical protein